jgi:hypothetical protein
MDAAGERGEKEQSAELSGVSDQDADLKRQTPQETSVEITDDQLGQQEQEVGDAEEEEEEWADDDGDAWDVESDAEYESQAGGPRKRGRPKRVFDEKDQVLVERGGLLWAAHVMARRGQGQQDAAYRVRYEGWPSDFDEWLPPSYVRSCSKVHLDEESKRRRRFLKHRVQRVPEELLTLRAAEFVDKPDRARAYQGRPPPNFTQCTDAFSAVRGALLLVEGALPCGAWDMGEERGTDNVEEKWSEQMGRCWLQHTMSARSVVELMECQLLLEHGIKHSWLLHSGSRAFACLPSRYHALKYANLGSVAMRVWMLDQAILYDKVARFVCSSSCDPDVYLC